MNKSVPKSVNWCKSSDPRGRRQCVPFAPIAAASGTNQMVRANFTAWSAVGHADRISALPCQLHRYGLGETLDRAGDPAIKSAPMNETLPPRRRWLARAARRVWAVTWRALVKYDETDGEQRSASFAYYAFFALFPLLVLLITVGTTFFGSQAIAAARITEQIQHYIPIEEDAAGSLLRVIRGVVRSRRSASFIALGVLAWSALRFFQALVRGVNRAWGTKEISWWRLPIKNLFMTAILASALLLGTLAPAVVNQIEYSYWKHSWEVGLDFQFAKVWFSFVRFLVPPFVLFYGFLMFYKFAPRRRTTFREVWVAAVFATLGLDILQRLFALYTTNIGHFNALYGTFGSVVALLMWIYLSGSIILLGGCISAAQHEIKMHLKDQSESHHER